MRLARIVSLSVLCLSALVRPAFAEEPATVSTAQATLDRELMKPLAKHDSERRVFSRVFMPPVERRLRVDAAAPVRDARGQEFVTFAIDTRTLGGEWTQATISGCFYPQDGATFVKRGEEFRAAAMLLGKKSENPPEAVCRAAQVAAVP